MVENRLQRPSGVYICPVFSSRMCVHARHVILMVLHVLYQVIIINKIYLMCDALCDSCLPRSFCYFFFLRSFCYISFFNFFFNFHFSLKLFLIFSYFSGNLSLAVLIKCVLNKKKCTRKIKPTLNTQGTHLKQNYTLFFYKNNFIRTTRLKFAQKLRTS